MNMSSCDMTRDEIDKNQNKEHFLQKKKKKKNFYSKTNTINKHEWLLILDQLKDMSKQDSLFSSSNTFNGKNKSTNCKITLHHTTIGIILL